MKRSSHRVAIVIPTWTGEISRLKASIARQTFQDFELVVVEGVSPAGRARNLGVGRTDAELIVFIDDDASFGAPDTLQRLVAAADEHPEYAVLGTAKLLPPDATPFQRRTAVEVPRWVYPVSETLVESNPPVSHYGFSALSTTCVLMRRSWYERVGGFDESLPTGPEDTEFFFRLRRAGARFAMAGQTWVYHPPPASLRALMRKSFAYGVGHALEASHEPSRGMQIIPLDRWYGKLLALLAFLCFLPSLFISYYYEPVRHWRFGWRPIKACSSYSSLCGYISGWYQYKMVRKQRLAPGPAPSAPARSEPSAGWSSMLSIVAVLSVAVLNYAYTTLLAWMLPVGDYGALGLAQSWILIASTLLNSGFPWVLARTIAVAPPRSVAFSSAKSALAGNVAIAVVLCLVVATSMVAATPLGAGQSWIIVMIVVEVLLLAVAAMWAGVLQGSLRFGTLSLNRFLEALIKLVVGAGLVWLGYGLVGAIGGFLLGTAVSLALLTWSNRRFAFWREPSWGKWRDYSSSMTIFVGLSALTVIGNLDIIGLKLFSPAGEGSSLVGHYQSAVTLTRIPVLLAGAYAAALFPYASRARGEEARSYFVAGMRYTLLLIIPFNLVLLAIPDVIIGMIFPAEYQPSKLAIRLAAGASTCLALLSVVVALLQARGVARSPALWLSLMAGVEIVALALLVPVYGMEGAALAILLASVLGFAGLFVLCQRHFAWQLEPGAALKYLAAAGLLVATLVALPSGHPAWLLLSLLAATSLYLLVLTVAGLLRPTDVLSLAESTPFARVPWVAAALDNCSRAVARLNSFLSLPDPS